MPARVDRPLTNYFDWLTEQLKQGRIENESTLSQTAGIPKFDFRETKTLLQALGYNAGNVQPEMAMQQGTNPVRVDFCIGEKAPYWLLDLKAPDVACDLPGCVGQIQSYMKLSISPLGVLFNGISACAFVNVAHPALRNFDTLDPDQPVRVASAGDLPAFFMLFRSNKINGRPDRVAVQLAREWTSPIFIDSELRGYSARWQLLVMSLRLYVKGEEGYSIP